MKGRSHRHDLHEDWIDGSWTVDCVCGVNFDDGEEMVNCDECGVWVHTRCSRYVKGDELFTCDKCKNKNIRDDSEETEVAQLLVELPTKTIRLESSYAAPGGPTTRRPIRLWTDIPMEERVHVQGIPGGDPALFTGLSSVFTPELWKCTGYVPKKFNFNYREFPCWDENMSARDGTNEDANEITVNKGAGVLFSLAKQRVLATPTAALVGMRDRSERGTFDGKEYSRERKNWENDEGDVRHSLGKERSLLRPAVIHLDKRKKEDLGTSKDQSAKKKVRIAYKEVDAKKRGSHVSRNAFTSTSDAKPLEFYEDGGSKSLKNDSRYTPNKNLRNSTVQEQESRHHASTVNDVENTMNSTSVINCSSETFGINVLRDSTSTLTGLDEEQASDEMVDCSPKLDDIAAPVPDHKDVGKVHGEQGGDKMPNGTLNENVEGSIGSDVKPPTEGSIGSDVKPPTEELASTIPEAEGEQSMIVNITQLDVKVGTDDDNSREILNGQSSVRDAKDTGTSHDNTTVNFKLNGAALSGKPFDDHKAEEVDAPSEAVSDCHSNKHSAFSNDSFRIKQESEGSDGPVLLQKCSSEPKLGTVVAEELSKSGGTIVSSSLSSSQTKIVLCVGKSSSASATFLKSSAIDNIISPDTVDSNSRQRAMSECNSIIKKGRAALDVFKVKDEEIQDTSRKNMKERPKSSVNSASKASSSSKVSHAPVIKSTFSDSIDSAHRPTSKTSSMQNTSETSGLLQHECASRVQNKALTPGLPSRCEKFNQSNSQLSFKAHHASSMNPSPSIISSTNLSDEELALRLHQELNSSPRVSRPRVRQTGSLPQLSSPNATSMLIKRTSSSGGRDHSLVSRRKTKDSSKYGFSRSLEPDIETRKTNRVSSSTHLRGQDSGFTADELSKREDNELPAAVHSVKRNIPPTSTSTANSGPSSSAEVNDLHLSSTLDSRRDLSDEEAGTVRAPIHRTLPGLINEIMSKGRRMTYEELCNAVLPHWHNLRKHNGERYAYSSPSQAVLDCLRNRHEWAQLVDRGPKTSSSRKRRKLDADESEDNDFVKGRSGKEGEGKSLESRREDVPKGKRNARKRRRLALQGRRIKEIRKRRKVDVHSDDDSGSSSNSSEDSLFSEEEEIRGSGGGKIGDDASGSSDDEGTM